jgi:hypothetical protein
VRWGRTALGSTVPRSEQHAYSGIFRPPRYDGDWGPTQEAVRPGDGVDSRAALGQKASHRRETRRGGLAANFRMVKGFARSVGDSFLGT